VYQRRLPLTPHVRTANPCTDTSVIIAMMSPPPVVVVIVPSASGSSSCSDRGAKTPASADNSRVLFSSMICSKNATLGTWLPVSESRKVAL
jgi:hypothetical protein